MTPFEKKVATEFIEVVLFLWCMYALYILWNW